MKRRYRRYFVMLEVEDKSTGIVQKEVPKGYGKIEVKNDQGTLAINCQNLSNDNKNNRYRWYLINTKKEGEPTIVEIGPMEVDEKGKGDVDWEFNAENVKGSMEEIDSFNVLVLALQNKDDKNNLVVPLIGYVDKEKSASWRYALEKHLYITPKKESKKEENVQEHKPQEETHMPKEELQNSMKSDQGNIPITDGAKKITEDPKEEIEENQPVAQENITKEAKQISIKEDNKIEEEKVQEDEMDDEDSYGVQMQGYIENALKDLPKVDPFISNLENYTWWQIPYNYQTIYRSYMPFISYVDSVKGPANYYASKMMQNIYLHKHHIFGILYDENNVAKYYAYGVPGRKHPSEQPYEGATGFTYWHPCDSGPYDMYSHGYWILIIDPKTGKTIKDTQS